MILCLVEKKPGRESLLTKNWGNYLHDQATHKGASNEIRSKKHFRSLWFVSGTRSTF